VRDLLVRRSKKNSDEVRGVTPTDNPFVCEGNLTKDAVGQKKGGGPQPKPRDSVWELAELLPLSLAARHSKLGSTLRALSTPGWEFADQASFPINFAPFCELCVSFVGNFGFRFAARRVASLGWNSG